LHNAPSSTSNPSSQKTPFQTTNHPKRKNPIYTQKQQQNHQLLLLLKIIIIMNSCRLLPSLSLSLSPSQTYQRVDLAATNSCSTTTVSPPVIRFSHRHKHEQQRQQGQAATNLEFFRKPQQHLPNIYNH
jgi:hypothetical protein